GDDPRDLDAPRLAGFEAVRPLTNTAPCGPLNAVRPVLANRVHAQDAVGCWAVAHLAIERGGEHPRRGTPWGHWCVGLGVVHPAKTSLRRFEDSALSEGWPSERPACAERRRVSAALREPTVGVRNAQRNRGTRTKRRCRRTGASLPVPEPTTPLDTRTSAKDSCGRCRAETRPGVGAVGSLDERPRRDLVRGARRTPTGGLRWIASRGRRPRERRRRSIVDRRRWLPAHPE